MLRVFDRFPRDVPITFRGESKFKTKFSGVVSLVFLMIFTVYVAALIQRLTSKSRIYTNQTTNYFNINGDTIYDLTDSDLAIAFDMFLGGVNETNMNSIYSIGVDISNSTRNPNTNASNIVVDEYGWKN